MDVIIDLYVNLFTYYFLGTKPKSLLQGKYYVGQNKIADKTLKSK